MEIAQNKPHFSIPSLIAVAAAIASFFMSAGAGFILAIVAIFFGLIGFLLAMAPSVRGGILSIISLIIACLGIGAAIVRVII